MFGRKKKRLDENILLFEDLERPAIVSGPDSFVQEGPLGEEMARYDRLGANLVATVTVEAVSGNEATQLIHQIRAEAQGAGEPVQNVILDLQNVQYMDSACIGAMVEFLTLIQSNGGRIALVNAGHNVEYLFRMTRLDRLFPICKDVMAAITTLERAA